MPSDFGEHGVYALVVVLVAVLVAVLVVVLVAVLVVVLLVLLVLVAVLVVVLPTNCNYSAASATCITHLSSLEKIHRPY